MSVWRGILQRKDDEWTSSFRGLDGIEEKPEIYNENIPAFKHNGVHLVNHKELRSDEAFLEDFSPFVCKKTDEEKRRLREDWFGSNVESDTLQAFLDSVLGQPSATAEDYAAIDAQELSLFEGSTGGKTESDIESILHRLESKSFGGGIQAATMAGGFSVGREDDLDEVESSVKLPEEALKSATYLRTQNITQITQLQDALENAEATIERLKGNLTSEDEKDELLRAYHTQSHIYNILGQAEKAKAAQSNKTRLTTSETFLQENPIYQSWKAVERDYTYKEMKAHFTSNLSKSSYGTGLGDARNKESMIALLVKHSIAPPKK